MMTVSAISVGASGILSIVANDAPDNITVYQAGTSTMVRSLSPTGASTTWNMGTSVRSITVNAAGGDDVVNNNTNLPSTLYGGTGNDRLNGGSAADWIYGQGQNDILDGKGGNDYLFGDADNDTIYGGGGDDTIYAGTGNDLAYGDDALGEVLVNGVPAGNDTIWGGDGHDQLYGSRGNDRIFGELGEDYLYGGEGNDRLYGGASYDHLLGQNGDDFMDTGSSNPQLDYSSGGAGNDFNAYVTTVNGAIFNDVAQGTAGNCFILTAIGEAAQHGVDLASRITTSGGGQYYVSLFQKTSAGAYRPTTVRVEFDGTVQSFDSPAHFRGQEGESWVIIMNRAIAQVLNVDLSTVTQGSMEQALGAIYGRDASSIQWADPSFTAFVVDPILTNLYQLANSRPTIAGTPNSAVVDTTLFTRNHAYMVHSVIITGYTSISPFLPRVPQYTVVLYNPHGVDNASFSRGEAGARASGDNNDGLITISGQEFKRNFSSLTFV